MKFDFAVFYAEMEREAQASANFESSMLRLVDRVQEWLPESDLSPLKQLDFSADMVSAKDWFKRLWSERPAQFDTRALYFGISEEFVEDPETSGIIAEYARLYLVLFSEYKAGDETLEWIYGNNRFDYDDARAELPALEAIGMICHQFKSGGSESYIALSVAYCVLLVKYLVCDLTTDGAAQTVGVVTGFSSGDLFKVCDVKM
ncbi:MAG: hypothetical protein EKK48_29685 [Candidatus Melainabacteria bacterium]|nr:MAG: hypothetical protein EKK48_29685 [Candidatus Melainabacteria bacterium]